MQTTEMAKTVIDNLPPESTLDDIIHALYVKAKFETGLNQIEQGKGISHDSAREKMGKWLR